MENCNYKSCLEIERFQGAFNPFANKTTQLDKTIRVPEKVKLSSKNSIKEQSRITKVNFLRPKLENLNISSCNLVMLPQVICNFKYLRDLNLSNNELVNLPKEINRLQNLISLNLSGNKLTNLPKTMKDIYQLKYLNLSRNKFVEVPEILFYGLRNLKILDLSFNHISTFKDSVDCLSNILELRLTANLLEEWPAWLFDNQCQLEVLHLNENAMSFSVIPLITYYSAGIFETLEVLNIENCNSNYEKLEFLAYFKKLKVVFLGNQRELEKRLVGKNYFGNLKMDIFKSCIDMKLLCMKNVQISLLPIDVDIIKNVELVNLSDNILSWLPDNFCNLSHLKILNLSSNQLLFLPNDIDKLVNLKIIHLDNNRLTQLPNNFIKLVTLEFVDLYNNNLGNIDEGIFTVKNLKGIDLGLNCIDFNFYDGVRGQYDCLKNNFRRLFGCSNNRVDTQTLCAMNSYNELDKDASDAGSMSSLGLSESTIFAEGEECSTNSINSTGLNIDDDWEHLCEVEEDELFDPNGANKLKETHFQVPWSLNCHKNFCPAKGHTKSAMRTYCQSCDIINEGQFDSD